MKFQSPRNQSASGGSSDRQSNTSQEADSVRTGSRRKAHSKITFGDALGFAIGDMFGGGSGILTGTYLSVFWTRFCGFDIGTAQSMIGAAAMLSACSAIIFGVLSERFYLFRLGRRFGRRRFFVMILSPLVLVTLLMWIPGMPKALYFLVYVLYVTLQQMFGVCYSSLPGEMTRDFAGRSLLSTVRMFVSGMSGVLIPILATAMLTWLGEWHAYSYQAFVTIITVVFSIVTFASSRLTWELTPEEAGFGEAELARRRAARHRRSPREVMQAFGRVIGEYTSTFHIATFRVHITLYLICLTLMDIFTQSFVYFVVFDLGKTAAFASMLLSFAVIAEFLKPLWGWLFVHIGPRNLYALDYTGALAGLGLLFVSWRLEPVLPDGVWTVFVIASSIVWFVFRSLAGAVPWLVFPFIPDVDMIVTRRNRASIFSGITTFLRFVFSGLASMAVGAFLAFSGFEPDKSGAQTPMAVNAVAFVCLGWLAIGFIAAFIVSRRFTLDQRSDLIVLQEIERLKAGGSKADVEPHVRETVEKLTGVPYERCWR
ncbi:MFS transporter [Bifidobacterium vansinderenii]|uniref:Sodium:galactoside symporter n=1 Tax=Bifidobacterium vansinderenii TaxID=1984871 RepID=A0A229VW58_9BIFI|nr:MFS transporter [Bifidobacterium vansinderenii]OXM99854.1 sodium:galactoside symporter [Bifidobacterium vansinderenii]